MIGTKVGPYEIREEISSGGIATVYRAYQPTMDRYVAIKVIKESIAGDESAVRRFQREARLIARLEHPHILPVYDFDGGHDPPYIVMRYLDGGTLKDIIKRGALPLAEIGYLVWQVGSALDYAHRQGIVHRDIKPSNIMIDREGNAFVTDFGIARMLPRGGTGTQLTITGAIVGTPDYMSPEQARGNGDVDHRADIYGLGVLLFEMLTGKLPYMSQTPMGVLFMHIQDPIPSAVERKPDLPSAVDEVLARALAKNRVERYPTAAAFVEAVTRALGETISGSPTHLRQAAEESAILRRGRAKLKPGEAARLDSGSETPSEQNKVVTALYASAAEYAEIVEEIAGSEVARKAVGDLWDAAARIVITHHGLVFERSERLLALWGAGVAREDDAEQAIRVALEMQSALRELGADVLSEEGNGPLPLKIGIHTGLALLSPTEDIGAYAISGTTISLTNRLMHQAEGTILISHDTYNQVRGMFFMESVAPLKVRRGRVLPDRDILRVYRVVGSKAHAFRRITRGVEGVETQMIGRETELKQLQNAYFDALEGKETQVVTITGEAGFGKSRLLYEFSDWSDLRPEQFWLLRGRALPEMTHRPYTLIRDVLSFRYGILDNDSPTVARQKLEAGIRLQIGPDDEMAHMIGHLAGFDVSDSPFIKGLLTDPQQLTGRARQLFVRWLVKLCAIQPAVIELEDLHYADAPSLDLLAELVSEHDDLPLLIVCTARPSLYERRPTWGSGQRSYTRIDLRPLDRWTSRSLVREILQRIEHVPKTLRDLLVERAEGNPYYMEELTKMLIDDRVIIKENDEVWRVEADRVGHLSVPSTLAKLLQARLDSLLYPERLTMQRAAAVGRVFHDSALAALDAADETHMSDLHGILRRLAEREFIRVRGTTAFAGNAEYVFASQMLRDLLLDTLLRRQRQAYNKACAEWLIQISGERAEEYNGLIADYYERAGEDEKAAHYLQRAAEKSLQISAFGEARALFRRALKLSPLDTPGGLPLRLRLGEVCYYLGEYSAARGYLVATLEAARRNDDKRRIADTLYWLSQVAAAEGDYTQAQVYLLAESLPLARAGGDTATLARVLYGLGDLNWRLGYFDEARAQCEESLALTRQIGDTTQELYALNRLGAVAVSQNNLDKAQQLLEEAQARALQAGNRERAAVALNNLGELAWERSDVTAAQAYYQQALPIVREIGNQQLSAVLLNNLASGYVRIENWTAAQQHLQEGLALARQIGATPMVLMAVKNAGCLLVKQGSLQRGLARLGLALHHPASYSNLEREVNRALIHLGLDATDKEVAAGLEAGEALDLEVVVEELLEEFKI